MAYDDPAMAIQGSILLSTKSTTNVSLCLTVVTSFIVILTAFCDWQIIRLNRHIHEKRLVKLKKKSYKI